MLYIVLDTSCSNSFIAIFSDSDLLKYKIIPSNDLSANLLLAIETIFQEIGYKLEDLSFIACGIGPGSFTGTRIGIITAKALAYCMNIPIVNFCSLKSFLPENLLGTVKLVTDARSQQAYEVEVTLDKTKIYFSEPKLIKLSELSSDFIYYSPDKSLFSAFENIQESSINFCFLASYLKERFEKKDYIFSINLRPLYLKSP